MDDRESTDPDVADDGGGYGTVDGCNVTVPPGEYVLGYSHYETGNYFGGPKVVLHMGIIEPDRYAGLEVERYYNVKALLGKPKWKGNFRAKSKGTLIREFRRIVGERGERLDRISFDKFSNIRIKARIVTVYRDHSGQPLSPDDCYSKVDELIGPVSDDSW